MKMTKVAAAFFVVGMACNPTLGWSQPADVFPSFGSDKEVSGVDVDFRGGAEGCAAYVYEHTGIQPGLHLGFVDKNGNDEGQWKNLSTKRGYSTSNEPKNNSVGLMAATKASGHVYFVGSVKKNGNNYAMTNIKQSNWPGNPTSGTYTKNSGTGTVKFSNGNTSYKSWGFITSLKNGKSIKWNE